MKISNKQKKHMKVMTSLYVGSVGILCAYLTVTGNPLWL